MKLLATWIINALSLMAVTHLMPGIHVRSLENALVVALVLGLVNTFLRPILLLLTLPVNILTLGLFTFIVNGFCFYLVVPVSNFASAIVGALVYSVISWLAASILLSN